MSVEKGMKMAEAEMRSRTMATKGVEVPTADEDEFGDAKGGGASGHGANVVPFGYVMHHNVAFDPHSEFNGDELIENEVMGFRDFRVFDRACNSTMAADRRRRRRNGSLFHIL